MESRIFLVFLIVAHGEDFRTANIRNGLGYIFQVSVVMLKSITPRIDPCGQPVTASGADQVEDTLTDIVLPDKKLVSSRRTGVEAPR